MGHTPALVGPRGCGPAPRGLSDIYCAEETSACRTPTPQTVPTLLPGTPAVSYRPQTRPSGSRCSHPKPPAHVLPQLLLLPISVINTPWWGRGLWEGRSCATRLLGRGDTGTRGHGRWRAGAPSQSLFCHRPGAGGVLAAPWPCRPLMPAPMVPAVPSLPALSRSLPAFFSFFFPSNTSPRSTQGGGSTISHCECLSLYCSAQQNTVCPANKHPFICRPQHWEFRENDSSASGSSSLLGWQSLPSALAPRAGTVLSDPTDIRARVNFILLSLFLMKG